MQVKMREGAVPFVISYRKIIKKPEIIRRRVFVGPLQLAKNAAVKLIEFLENVAYETVTEVKDPGKSVAVHWAVEVEDPWDATPGREMNLVAIRMGQDMPPCGAHFEIVSPQRDEPQTRGGRPATGPWGGRDESLYDDPNGDPEIPDFEDEEEAEDGPYGSMPMV